MPKIFDSITRFRPMPFAPVTDKLCVYENLIGFRTEKELGAYHAKHCQSCAIYRKWKCPVCNGYHFLAKEMPGAGGSSGTQREVAMHLPRAEWEGKIQPQEPGRQFNVITFTENERMKFGDDSEDGLRQRVSDSVSEIIKRLESYGVQFNWNKRNPITNERVTLLFASTPIHFRRNEAGDMMYGWHETC